jgi:hypothetical protein
LSAKLNQVLGAVATLAKQVNAPSILQEAAGAQSALVTVRNSLVSDKKAFKKSHERDVERLASDRRREAESKAAPALKNARKHTVLCMKGLTSPVWTMGMFQMVTGDSCQCMKRTKQSTACDISVRHAACTVPGCEFVARYQNTSNLENHYVTARTDGGRHI